MDHIRAITDWIARQPNDGDHRFLVLHRTHRGVWIAEICEGAVRGASVPMLMHDGRLISRGETPDEALDGLAKRLKP
jgi:hypothetical protein